MPKKLLVAITNHNIDRPTLTKTVRSVTQHMPDDEKWTSSVCLFIHEMTSITDDLWADVVRTTEETLGGKRNHAIDYAIRHAKADLIAFLDDDDLFGSSWLKELCALYDRNEAAGISNEGIAFHPQWNVLFTPRNHWVMEHLDPTDPRFDSRNMMFYNPYSALTAFNPKSMPIRYHKHKKSDPVFGFEDWSFNLDVFTDAATRHVVVPDTYHFLRIRQASLGKSTMHNSPKHKTYFENPQNIRAITAKTPQTPDTLKQLNQDHPIDVALMESEFAKIHEIEPTLYFYRNAIDYRANEHMGEVADAVADIAEPLLYARDIFWMPDHNRKGGAEKALRAVADYLKELTGGSQAWIDDVPSKGYQRSGSHWAAGINHVLRCALDTPDSHLRSIHICNSGPGWTAIMENPEAYRDVQVYFYVFNDEPVTIGEFAPKGELARMSPLYNYVDKLDRPNFHIITDNDRMANKLDFMGLGHKTTVISVPVQPMDSKRKEKPDGVTDILWAGRTEGLKGFSLATKAAPLAPSNIRFHFYGDGQGCTPYSNFNDIPGKYDFLLFTSDDEGMPNVVKEALAAQLPVLARRAPWNEDLGWLYLFRYYATSPKDLVAVLDDFVATDRSSYKWDNFPIFSAEEAHATFYAALVDCL